MHTVMIAQYLFALVQLVPIVHYHLLYLHFLDLGTLLKLFNSWLAPAALMASA